MGFIRTVLDLFVVMWPVLPSDAFHGNEDQVNDFTFKLAESKIAELNATSTVAALVAGVVTTIYSWPLYEQAPWPAKLCYGISFLTSLLSVRKALKHSYVLRRLELHGCDSRTKAGDRIRSELATKEVGSATWKPHFGLQVMWNSSVLYLNIAIMTLLIGYTCSVLAAALDASFSIDDGRTKVAVGLLTVAALFIPHYWASEILIYSNYVRSHR